MLQCKGSLAWRASTAGILQCGPRATTPIPRPRLGLRLAMAWPTPPAGPLAGGPQAQSRPPRARYLTRPRHYRPTGCSARLRRSELKISKNSQDALLILIILSSFAAPLVWTGQPCSVPVRRSRAPDAAIREQAVVAVSARLIRPRLTRPGLTRPRDHLVLGSSSPRLAAIIRDMLDQPRPRPPPG